jgi:hypothetical protein
MWDAGGGSRQLANHLVCVREACFAVEGTEELHTFVGVQVWRRMVVGIRLAHKAEADQTCQVPGFHWQCRVEIDRCGSGDRKTQEQEHRHRPGGKIVVDPERGLQQPEEFAPVSLSITKLCQSGWNNLRIQWV